MWVPPYSSDFEQYFDESLDLLKDLIAIPSFSKEEDETADALAVFFRGKKIDVERIGNNVIVRNRFFDPDSKTILLNSHHDTVRPSGSYTRDPHEPSVVDDKLFGLGSNDAGGCLVSLIATFLYFNKREDLPFNLLLVASAEEEISGKNGIELVLQQLQPIDFLGAIVGEPTEMQAAVAEKGLMVVDCYAQGESGHAARDTGQNAIYHALDDIQRIKEHSLDKVSDWLGNVKMSVTMIEAGTQHNVIPDQCHFVVDVRSTDIYDNKTILEYLKSHLKSKVVERSLRLNSSELSSEHVFYRVSMEEKIPCFGSPTMSDQALIPFSSIKLGPGRSERSHMADEFIYLEDIRSGIAGYIHFLQKIMSLL